MKFGSSVAEFHETGYHSMVRWPMFPRVLDIKKTLKRKSLFLLGPRMSGKTTYLKRNFKEAHLINLLKPELFLRYKANPELFGKEIEFEISTHNKKLFIIDEIQKIPALLDEVHNLIEEHKSIRFILTGSSARKLKRAGVNLLGGRASRYHFHPLVSAEIGFERFEKDLLRTLTYGTLPSILMSEEPWAELEDYVSLYLKEEIQQEAVVRSLDGFARFLNSVATTSSQQLNFTEIGNDAQVPPRTVREYYKVLEDTLVGNLLLPFEKTVKRKAVATAKFYLFDTGVTNYLLGRKSVAKKSTEFGGLFEQMIFNEIRAYLDYHQQVESLFYWRSTSQLEVDFLVKTKSDEWVGIEVKSSKRVSHREYRGLFALEEELELKRKIVVCWAEAPYVENKGVEILPYLYFLKELWSSRITGA